ncbi:MAG: sigma-70 family RNA polymerase sigma factor [Planctomycetes bacterium]|nr:sigma-70 family RNA polymerase sigma factor [Planctomycetota bacterium]
MEQSERLELFEKIRARYSVFLTSVLWKLAGDKELFTEAMQYALLGIWQHIEKLKGEKAGAYVYRIALTSNSRAWRNRIGRNGHISTAGAGAENAPDEELGRSELAALIRREISKLPLKQGRAIVMRYMEQQGYQTIAESLRCTKAGARSHVSRALATLKNKLAVLA